MQFYTCSNIARANKVHTDKWTVNLEKTGCLWNYMKLKDIDLNRWCDSANDRPTVRGGDYTEPQNIWIN